MTSSRCTLLPWDTEFWGRRIGRLEGGTLREDELLEVDAWALDNGVSCLYFLAAADDAASAQVAEDGGFRLMDVRIELERPTNDTESQARIRIARADDLAMLRAIARASHSDTRFYADPRFPRERCDDLYDTWITRSLDGYADVVLVCDADGRVGGYVACHARDEAGNIGLIAVDESARGRGLGQALVQGAVAWSHGEGLPRITVVTQGRNVPAQRVFQSCGFRVSSVALWFHKWYDA